MAVFVNKGRDSRQRPEFVILSWRSDDVPFRILVNQSHVRFFFFLNLCFTLKQSRRDEPFIVIREIQIKIKAR